MSEDLYKAPSANLEEAQVLPEIPEAVEKKIKNAWIAGLISIAITSAFTLFSMFGSEIMGLNAMSFIDVFLMAIFTFGIYKKSRICAVLMLLLFVANKYFMWQMSGEISGLPIAIIFLWFYSMGVVGTFQYHKIRASQAKS